ncbi:phosphatase PAP2 family protein [Streptomyces sp. NPDC055722]
MSPSPESDLEYAPTGQGRRPPVPGRPACLPALSALAALLFLLITWQVSVHGPLLRLDERLSGTLTHPGRLSEFLSALGDVSIALPVLAGVLIGIAWHDRLEGTDRWWLPPAAAAGTMAAVPALVVPLKALIARPTPPIMGPATGLYPSGHTATAAIAYGSATLLLWPRLRTPQARRGLLGVCLCLNLGVAFGLVRRGYHWPLDVLASWCLCTVLLSLLWGVLSRSSRRTSAGTPSSRSGPS